MVGKSADDVAREVVERVGLLETIADRSPVTARELAEEHGASVSTINRIVASLSGEHIVERTPDGVAITPSGAALLDTADQFVDAVGTIRTLQPVLASLENAPIPFELEWFLEATVSTSTPKHPYAPLTRYSELFASVERKRLIGNQFVIPEYGVEAAMQAFEKGTICSCVWSERALERMAEEYPDMVEWSAGRDDIEAAISETVPFDLAILDDRLLVYGFDEKGIMSVLVDTDDPAAVDWGLSVFEACFEAGELVEL
ncbi:helix-turn-helix transcriptional regulator [Natronobeatus ordinarius]|uniref:helix-turn-helix transcriptional regulator n=1 Tax=Natronobeatus ordinarius TaxID=2963433 RepID=UPI0020CCAA65|nr:MarR family transcriptional regulator [Natronobeatus ordinarius]